MVPARWPKRYDPDSGEKKDDESPASSRAKKPRFSSTPAKEKTGREEPLSRYERKQRDLQLRKDLGKPQPSTFIPPTVAPAPAEVPIPEQPSIVSETPNSTYMPPLPVRRVADRPKAPTPEKPAKRLHEYHPREQAIYARVCEDPGQQLEVYSKRMGTAHNSIFHYIRMYGFPLVPDANLPSEVERFERNRGLPPHYMWDSGHGTVKKVHYRIHPLVDGKRKEHL